MHCLPSPAQVQDLLPSLKSREAREVKSSERSLEQTEACMGTPTDKTPMAVSTVAPSMPYAGQTMQTLPAQARHVEVD